MDASEKKLASMQNHQHFFGARLRIWNILRICISLFLILYGIRYGKVFITISRVPITLPALPRAGFETSKFTKRKTSLANSVAT